MEENKIVYEGKIKIYLGHPKGAINMNDKFVCEDLLEKFNKNGLIESGAHENIFETKHKYKITIERIE